MPRNRVSTDVDHVIPDPRPSNPAKKPPPAPWPKPQYAPIQIQQPYSIGAGQLPSYIDPSSPYDVFSLYFDESCLQTLVNHTNKYAELHAPKPEQGRAYRPWQATTTKELRAYIATWIWMGLHQDLPIESFWNQDLRCWSRHTEVSSHISKNRWQQIDRFLHISEPHLNSPKETPFDKLEPLSSHLRLTFKQYWRAGTHLTIDETIQRFMGRAHEVVNIPSKPTPEGFKIWVLANQGYVLDWMYHAKGDRAGPIDLDDFWTEDRGFSKTQAVVLDLVSQEGIRKDHYHIIWLDNLFTSASLLTELKKEGFGGAGTIRIAKTAREEDEEKVGTTKQRQRAQKEHNRGIQPDLAELKIRHSLQIPWGTEYTMVSNDGEVFQMAWKDQAIVLFMSTVSDGTKKIVRRRRRPAKSATNARTSRIVFGDAVVKDLAIPDYIDMYNHFMNGVDIADQLRSYYNTQKSHWKSWKALWHFLLDTTITNAYLQASSSPARPWAEDRDNWKHREFRIRLANQLFDHSERLQWCPFTAQPMAELVHRAAPRDHGKLQKLGNIPRTCIPCRNAHRKTSRAQPIRKPLEELSVNTVRVIRKERKRPERIPRTRHGCALCQMYICDHKRCWNEHLEAIQ